MTCPPSASGQCLLPSLSSRLVTYYWLVLCLVWFHSSAYGDVRINSDLKAVTVHEGDEASFLCLTSSIPPDQWSDPVKVQWEFKGQILPLDIQVRGDRITSETFENRHELTIRHTRPSDQGDYTCIIVSGQFRDTSVGRLTVQSAPEPPTQVMVKSCYGVTAHLTWRPGRDNGAPIQSYAIQYSISDQPDTWYEHFADFIGPKTNEHFVNLSPYGVYSFRVVAKNEVGTSSPSPVTSRTCTTPPDRPGSNPDFPKSRTDKMGYLVIEWEPMRRMAFHGPGFHYVVWWRWKGTVAWNSAVVQGSNTSRFEVEVDKVYTVFEYRVKSANDLGEAIRPTYVYKGRSYEAEPQLKVSGLRLDESKEVTSSSAHFAWEAVDPKDPAIRGKFRGYKIIYWRWLAGQEKDYRVSLLIPGQEVRPGDLVRASVQDLPPHSAIGVKVVVVNTHYQGPPSHVIDVDTPEGVPSSVRRLLAKSVTLNSVTLSWFPPKQPNGMLTGYEFGWQQVIGNRLSDLRRFTENNPNKLRIRISKLKPDTRYRIHIAAKTRVGPGEPSFIDVKTKPRSSKHKASTASDQASSPYLKVDSSNDADDGMKLDQSDDAMALSRPSLSRVLVLTLLASVGQVLVQVLTTTTPISSS